jgi:hypothetical protein
MCAVEKLSFWMKMKFWMDDLMEEIGEMPRYKTMTRGSIPSWMRFVVCR